MREGSGAEAVVMILVRFNPEEGKDKCPMLHLDKLLSKLCVCVPLILTVSPDCVNLQNILDPWSGYGCYGGA